MLIKVKRLVILIAMLMSLSACGKAGTVTNDTVSDSLEPTLSPFSWQIEIKEYHFAEELNTVVQVVQYDHSVIDVTYTNAPSPGYMFALINMSVTKIVPGNKTFSWNNVSIIDSKGNEYLRTDDVFLKDHNYIRISSADLKLGGNEGWACFEIPKVLKNQKLFLKYISEEGEAIIDLP